MAEEERKEKDEVKEKLEAQKKYCEGLKTPWWIPYDGVCYSCHRQIMNCYTLKGAKSTVITGCPHCHRSFVD